MSKSFLKIILAALGVFVIGLSACKKNNSVVDQDPLIPPTFAKFNSYSTLIYDSAVYYVKNTGESFKLPVGLTTISTKSREVNFTYSSSSAVQGVQYNAPASITIPAGSALDTLTISGIFSGIGIGDIYRLDISISTTDEVAASPYKNHFVLFIRKQCEIILTDFEGAFNNTYDNAGSYGPYTTTVTPGSITMITPTSATFTIENVWDPGVPVITTVNADWTLDPDHPTITIPDQEFFAPADIWIRGTVDGTFSACDQTITLRYTLYEHTSGADYSANQETVLAR